jgi:hypothetical protein
VGFENDDHRVHIDEPEPQLGFAAGHVRRGGARGCIHGAEGGEASRDSSACSRAKGGGH